VHLVLANADAAKWVDVAYYAVVGLVFLAGLLKRSPLQVPKKVEEAAGYLSRPEIFEILDSARNVAAGPDGRKTEAIKLVHKYTDGTKYALSDDEAAALIDDLTKKYGDVVHLFKRE
jgi:hypothetical protein